MTVAAVRTLYELLEPWREQIAFPAFGVWGPVGLYLGIAGARARRRRRRRAPPVGGRAGAASRAGAPLWEARATSQLSRWPN